MRPGCTRAAPTIVQIQPLLGHASPETTAIYFRAGVAELTVTVGRIFE
jgi:hypothetical protein